MKDWKLIDPRIQAKETPFTFYLPSSTLLEKLQAKDSAKLIFELLEAIPDGPRAERMWVTITERKNDVFTGTLENKPDYIKNLNPGDSIKFANYHIIDTSIPDPESKKFDYYFDNFCVVNRRIIENDYQPNFVIIDEPSRSNDIGWSVHAEGEDEEFTSNSENYIVVPIGKVLNADPRLADLLGKQAPCCYEIGNSGKWEIVDDFDWDAYYQ
ncbi:hypothetical protein CH371_20175 [Leptospira wolffii]|uniref:DUF2314 domain-containing protein n=1 Tax=Leptospira wolffii TaxID=409998 RepID=A0A2M9Z6J6_9LEPT|nr:DUF2185 domain-containing protein [Leptospira wolffii]PJZ64051.1 hypothetical protein CH371_20175 [Leptospira wolffii]